MSSGDSGEQDQGNIYTYNIYRFMIYIYKLKRNE